MEPINPDKRGWAIADKNNLPDGDGIWYLAQVGESIFWTTRIKEAALFPSQSLAEVYAKNMGLARKDIVTGIISYERGENEI